MSLYPLPSFLSKNQLERDGPDGIDQGSVGQHISSFCLLEEDLQLYCYFNNFFLNQADSDFTKKYLIKNNNLYIRLNPMMLELLQLLKPTKGYISTAVPVTGNFTILSHNSI